ncbi:hypothetical protein [Flavobacterium sp.]|uniref:hypothetical protein n=1 Tax=Flavobacterium sp. TaxID=239 RepID=UPI00374D626F
MKIEKKIVQTILENDLSLRNFVNDGEYLQYKIEDKELLEEIETFLGGIIEHDSENIKDRRECIETTIVYFEKHNCYIKEVAVGECHYKDVMIDGEYNSLEYYLVEPKEVKVVNYFDVEKLN